MKNRILSLMFLASTSWAQSNSWTERVFQAQSSQKNPAAAKQEMMSSATQKVAEEMIKEMIGEPKFQKNKNLIQNKILRSSARFVPFTKPGELEELPSDSGYKMTMTVKVNTEDLRAMLLEQGLFHESESAPIALPAIRIVDRVHGRNFAWWADGDLSQKAFLLKMGRRFEETLKSSFSKHNFYLLQPQSNRFANMLPASLRSENLRTEEWQTVAHRWGAPILIDGEIVLEKSAERPEASLISLRWTATQLSSSRVIAEVLRQFETEPGPFEATIDRKLKEALESSSQDLATQMLEAWQKGSLGASLYRIMVRGRLTLPQQEAFKEALKTKVREVKSVRERVISAEGVTFEVDSALGLKDLAQKAPSIPLSDGKIILESSSDKEVIYRISK